MEAYFTDGSRFDRPKRSEHEIYHLTLLAESNVGYHNLIQVSSAAYIDGYYYKPRTDWELFERYHEGLIATTGCLGGLVPQLILDDRPQEALEAAARFQDIFGRDHFFVEVQDHGLADDERVSKPLLDIARAIGAPLLATNDSHYTQAHEAEAHDALLCVQTGALMSDANRFRFEGNDFYIKSAAEMRDVFRDLPEACDNTLLVAERAQVELQFDNAVLPAFPVPQGHDENSYLRELALEGAKDRYGQSPALHVLERLEYELGVIKTMGFSAYFLVVWDLVRYAKSHNIRVGPGRGSAAGSCVAYCLRIVDIDPIKYDLLFERFLNPGRKEMPDIDMDFDSRYRGEMIKYAAQRYGTDRVAQVVTFSTIKARAAVRDAARVLGYPYGLGDKIAKLMPPLVMGRDTPLRACLEEDPKYTDGYKMATDLRELCAVDSDARRVVEVARGLEGLRRQDGIHAAAVVITRDPITDYLPIQRKPEPGTPIEESPIVTQYEMNGVGELGLLKMDFLGLRNLDVMEVTLEIIERSTGERVDIDAVALDDAKTFELLRSGRHDRRVPARGRTDAEPHPLARADELRRRRRPRRALPARPDGHEHAHRLRGPQERPPGGEVLPPRRRGDPRADLRPHDLPGAAHAGRAAARGLQPVRGRHAAEGRGEEEARPDGEGALEVRRQCRAPGVRPRVRRRDVRRDRAVRRLLVPEGPRVRLRLHRVPDRVPEGELPGPVPRRAAHEREVEPGQGRGLPQRVPAARHPGARSRRQRLRERLRRAAHVRRSRCGPGRGRASRGAGRRDPVRPLRGAQRR